MKSPWLAKMRSPSATSSGPTVNMMMRCDFPICDMLTPFIRARVPRNHRSCVLALRRPPIWKGPPTTARGTYQGAPPLVTRVRTSAGCLSGWRGAQQRARLVGDVSASRGLRLTSTADELESSQGRFATGSLVPGRSDGLGAVAAGSSGSSNAQAHPGGAEALALLGDQASARERERSPADPILSGRRGSPI